MLIVFFFTFVYFRLSKWKKQIPVSLLYEFRMGCKTAETAHDCQGDHQQMKELTVGSKNFLTEMTILKVMKITDILLHQIGKSKTVQQTGPT